MVFTSSGNSTTHGTHQVAQTLISRSFGVPFLATAQVAVFYPPTWLIAHAPREDWSVGGYDVPAETSVLMSTWLTQRAGVAKNASITFAGRNLHTWKKVPNIDPEFSYQTGNNQGIESMVLPNAKSWGLNVRITQ